MRIPMNGSGEPRRRRGRNAAPPSAIGVPLAKTNGYAPTLCVWCGLPHSPKFLCDPAALRLAQLYAASTAGQADVPEGMKAQALAEGDRLIRQLVVNAGVTEAAGAPRATLMLTGTDVQGQTLPRWLIIDEDHVVAAVAELIGERAHSALAAVQTIREQRAAGDPPPV